MNLSDDSRFIPAEFLRGAERFLATRRPLDALRLLRQALRTNPDHLPAHWLLARTYLDLGQPEQALKNAERALALAPDKVLSYFWRARALHDLNRIPESLSCVQEGLKKDPNNYFCQMLMARLLYDKGQLYDADEVLKRLRPLYPEDDAIDQLESWIAYKKGQYLTAEAHIRRALKRRPDQWAYHNDLARTLSVQGRHDEALEVQREALRLNPDSTLLRRNMHWFLQRSLIGPWTLLGLMLGVVAFCITVSEGLRPVERAVWAIITASIFVTGAIVEEIRRRRFKIDRQLQNYILTEQDKARRKHEWEKSKPFLGPLGILSVFVALQRVLPAYIRDNTLIQNSALTVFVIVLAWCSYKSFKRRWPS